MDKPASALRAQLAEMESCVGGLGGHKALLQFSKENETAPLPGGSSRKGMSIANINILFEWRSLCKKKQ
jgi:hypothetical protein